MMYEISYLPIAKKDLTEIINYISDHLKAPTAAINLLEDFNEAILRLQQFPFSCKVYDSKVKDFENEYRFLQVNNYLVFYIVKENIVEIHRILYSKMDLSKLIK